MSTTRRASSGRRGCRAPGRLGRPDQEVGERQQEERDDRAREEARARVRPRAGGCAHEASRSRAASPAVASSSPRARSARRPALDLVDRGKAPGGSTPVDQRVLGLFGLVDVEALGVRRRAGTRRSARRPAWSVLARTPAPAGADERYLGRRPEVVRHRRSGCSFLTSAEVVVVDEPDVDLACGNGLDDRGVPLVRLGAVRLHRPQATRASRSSPSERRMAVTNAWNDAFGGRDADAVAATRRRCSSSTKPAARAPSAARC